MSPRILDLDRCRHCKAELERPTPRVCPACGGSLQKRHLALGCLTSAPPPVLLLALVFGLTRGAEAPERAADEGGGAAASVPAPVPATVPASVPASVPAPAHAEPARCAVLERPQAPSVRTRSAR
jgi:hypothetical protein